MEKYLWRFYWDCGRQGSVDGLFIATNEEIKNAIDNEVNFGEILGKHSEIYGTLEMKDLDKLDIDPEAVEKVSKYLGSTWSGYNPLHYINYTCDICECSYNAEEFAIVKPDKKVCEYCKEEEKESE